MRQAEFMDIPVAQKSSAEIIDVEVEALKLLGSLERPDFSAVAKRLQSGWGGQEALLLADHYWTRIRTEPNTDSAVFLDLLSEDCRLLCAISAVGPFWSVARFRGQCTGNVSSLWDLVPLEIGDVDVCKLEQIIKTRFMYCNHALLSQRRVFDTVENNNVSVPIYKIVFSFGQELPWWD
jgi:hypothetical protein